VLGSEVARLGYRLDDKITLSHGLGELGPEHGDKPFRVTGILAPTGTPVDRTVHVSLESISALHLDWVGGAPLPGVNIPAEFVAKFDLRPKEITAALVGLKQRGDVFRMQRFVNQYRGEPLLAVLPGVALDELWQSVAMVERTLLASPRWWCWSAWPDWRRRCWPGSTNAAANSPSCARWAPGRATCS
jgi:putative ABC transport system permease protein